MADNSFRAYRSRDDIDANSPDSVRDPLAELARLIGQTDMAGDHRSGARREAVQRYEDEMEPVAPGAQWTADDRYDDQQQYAEESYAEPQAAEGYPALRDDYPRFSEEQPREPHFDNRYLEPAAEDDFHNAPTAYEDQYQDEPRQSRPLPALVPEARAVEAYEPEARYAHADAHDEGYQEDGQWHDEADDQGYAEDEYEYEDESAPRRSALSLILSVVGLIFIGAASAFAYHSMMGGRSFIPSLPPIIKASDTPNKIVPAQAASAGNPSTGDANTAEKLVPREEQPVPIQPQNAPPRVVATIPVVPQSPALPAVQTANAAQGQQTVFPPPPAPAAPPAPPPAPASSTEPKKIHTVTIRTNQPTATNIDPAAQSAPVAHAPASLAPKPAPAPRPSANAPLSLMPGSQSNAAPVQSQRMQVARAESANAPLATTPTGTSSASAGGGYSVQVTSQRSEAEAESAYKELQAKYPEQLGSHHASIHRAELGSKGTFYRAMVGPFASAEAAASMCSNLKAAGGSCIVQRN
jgi:hypothetical protein